MLSKRLRLYEETSREAVTATGTIEPVTQVEVGTQVSGIIDKLYADYNSIVTKGQLIAEMDKVTLQSELTSQQARTTEQKPNMNIKKKNFFRNKALHEKQTHQRHRIRRVEIQLRKS